MRDNCKFCNHELFDLEPQDCTCGCHETLKSMVDLSGGNLDKAKQEFIVCNLMADAKLTTTEHEEMTRLSMKAGTNADITTFTDAEMKFVSAMIKKMGL